MKLEQALPSVSRTTYRASEVISLCLGSLVTLRRTLTFLFDLCRS